MNVKTSEVSEDFGSLLASTTLKTFAHLLAKVATTHYEACLFSIAVSLSLD